MSPIIDINSHNNVNQEEYIEQHKNTAPPNEDFKKLLENSFPNGEIYSYPAIKNDQILEEIFEIFELKIPKELYSEFKIFIVDGVECPCILYNGTLNLDHFRMHSGISYTDIYFENCRGTFINYPSGKIFGKYIFLQKGDDDDRDPINIVLFHEIIHFFNSLKVPNKEESDLDFIFRNFVDEVEAYLLANKRFVTVQNFIYLKEKIEGIRSPILLNTEKELDIFANIYYSFYKSLLLGIDNLRFIIDIAKESSGVEDTYIKLKNTQFGFKGIQDIGILERFIDNIFRDYYYSSEPIDNYHLLFAEQIMSWSLAQLVNVNYEFEDDLVKQKFLSVINMIAQLYNIESVHADQNLKLHIYIRQLDSIERIVRRFVPDTERDLVLKMFSYDKLGEEVSRMNPALERNWMKKLVTPKR